MKNENLNNLKSNIKDIDFKGGNTRSLAMSLTKYVETKDAWDIAKAVAEAFGKDFKKSEAIEHILSMSIKSGGKVKVEMKDGKMSIPSTQKTVESKNGKIKTLLAEGKTVSEIAKLLGLQYQRVKNVEKALKRKSQDTVQA